MNANSDTIKIGDEIIFYCDEYRDNNISEYNGSVQSIDALGVDVLYLSGFHSRNDSIPFSDIIAKVDAAVPRIKLKNAPYNGHFVEFNRSV